MTEQLTKSRQTAEIAFAKTQSQFLARGRAIDEQDAITSARDEKTIRLREARLTREREARESATAAEGDFMADKEALELVRSYYAIPEAQRRRLFDLARVLSDAA